MHAALLAGLLSHIGLRDGESRDYHRARATRKFVLAPGSVLTKRPPRWVVVAELVETSRLYGRIAARIEPEAVERVAGHLVQRTYSEPHWDAKRGAVMAYERVTLYGLAARAAPPGRLRGRSTRSCRASCSSGTRWSRATGRPATTSSATTPRLRAELAELEERARRRDLLVGDDEIYAFYDARIPADVVSARHFDGWWKKQRHRTPDLLTFTRDDLLRVDDAAADRPGHLAGRATCRCR